MKKFFIKFLTVLLCLTLCFSLIACTQNDSGNGGNGGGGGNGGNGGGDNNSPTPSGLITTAELQTKLDAVTESETLKLDAGSFGVLTFKKGANSGQMQGDKPLYKRELNSVTIEGKVENGSNVSILKTFKFESSLDGSNQDIATKTVINTLTFKNVNFTENIKLIFDAPSLELCPVVIENLVFDGVVINNVNMVDVAGRHGVAIETNCGAIKNISFLNSQIKNVNSQNASGIHFNNAKGIEKITLNNTKILGINYNAFQLNEFEGELTIIGSKTSFTGSRALRIHNVYEGAKITITNNDISSVGGDEAFKISNVHSSVLVTISNNLFNGYEMLEEDYVIA